MATATRQTSGSMGRPRKELSKDELRTAKGQFATHLLALLEKRGMTTQDLADRAGLKEPAIRKWLRLETFPELETLMAVGKALRLKDYRDVLPPG